MNEAIERYHDGLAPEDRATCGRLAGAIERGLPSADGKVWHGHPVWFLEGNPIVGYAKRKDAVRLLFWSGRSFDEPELHPEGTFQAAGVRFTAVDQVDDEALARWLRKAADIQWDYKNIVKRKGRLERLK
ncbi:MAG: DUF1801 domain-containing protein [Trueperaceae bacterium]|nr:DUF1801 domain-containing protein [Trueperaceae bacterium]